MSRLLAIDYGGRRVGLAVTDPLKLIASPLQTVPEPELLSFLEAYLKKEDVAAIVLGMPKGLSGQQSATTRLVQGFARRLYRFLGGRLPLYTYDERFTSVRARKSLVEGAFKLRERREKGRLDALSATFLLRSFLVVWAQGQLAPFAP